MIEFSLIIYSFCIHSSIQTRIITLYQYSSTRLLLLPFSSYIACSELQEFFFLLRMSMHGLFHWIVVSCLIASTAAQSDTSITTTIERCVGPFTFPGVPSVPRICVHVGFAQCGSLALNMSIDVDDRVVLSAVEPDPLTFTYPIQLDPTSSCQAVFGLSQNPAPILTPTYVSAQPVIKLVCLNQEMSSQTLQAFTLGADCSSMDCYNCTQSSLCGWCSQEPDFLNQPTISDWNTYVTLNTHGKCVGKTSNNSPWCYTCKNTYAVNQHICPIYVGGGAEPANTNNNDDDDDGAHKESGLFNGSKGLEALLIIFLILIVILIGVIGCLCYKRMKSAQLARNIAYTKQAVEMHESDSPEPVVTNLNHRLMSDGSTDSYLPPTIPNSVAHVISSIHSSQNDKYHTVASGSTHVDIPTPQDL